MEVNEMAAEECRAVLEHASLGRLGCSYENQPYVVPIHFAYDSGSLYVFSTFGQKVKWMRPIPKCVSKRTRHRIRASGSASSSTEGAAQCRARAHVADRALLWRYRYAGSIRA